MSTVAVNIQLPNTPPRLRERLDSSSSRSTSPSSSPPRCNTPPRVLSPSMKQNTASSRSLPHHSSPLSKPLPKTPPASPGLPPPSSSRPGMKRAPHTTMGLLMSPPRDHRNRNDLTAQTGTISSFKSKTPPPVLVEDVRTRDEGATSPEPGHFWGKLRHKKPSIPMLRAQTSPISATIQAVASISEAFNTAPPHANAQPQLRTSTSSDETVAGSYTESPKSSLRKRAKAWARPAISRSPPREKGRSLPAEVSFIVDSEDDYGSETEVEDDDGGDSYAAHRDDVTIPPLGWTPSREFNLVDPAVRKGSKIVPQETYEVPYPVSYDKVMMENDDHAHELIKALIPNRSGLTFHQFPKPPSSVLDLGCGEGRWILEAATQWKHTRFTGLDLMDIQPELSHKYFDDVRDRVKWVHSNFLHYRLPFEACQFDFIRMSHVALAIPKHKWKGLLQEIRRVLKPTGVLEWIDEDSSVLPLATQPSSSLGESMEDAQELEHDFVSVLKQRQLYKPHKIFPSLLRGRAFSMRCEEVAKFKLALPSQKEDCVPFPSSTDSTPKQLKTMSTSSYVMIDNDDSASVNHSVTRAPSGLVIVGENKLLALSPSDVEAQASYNYQTLLGSKEAIWKLRQDHVADSSTDREAFESKLWDYECGRYRRLQLPSESASGWDDSDDDEPHANAMLATINHRRRSPLILHRIAPNPTEKLTVVRYIRVFHAYSESS